VPANVQSAGAVLTKVYTRSENLPKRPNFFSKLGRFRIVGWHHYCSIYGRNGKKGTNMNPSNRFLSLIIPAFALSIFISGCYTQLATTRDEDEGSYTGRNERAQASVQADSNAGNLESYYDEYDQQHGHYRVGFGYYYPSSWYWDLSFADPYYYGWPYYGGMYGDPFMNSYWGRYNPYSYGYGGYGYYPYGYYPYGYYSGYPYVVYGSSASRQSQTRESGYRRTGYSGVGGYSGVSGRTTGGTLTVPPASRRSGVQGSSAVAPTTRRSESPSTRSTRANSTPSGSRRGSAPAGGTVAPSGRSVPSGGSVAPSGRSAPSSGGSRSPEGGSRNSGSSRSRGYSDAPASGYYRADPGTQRNGVGSSVPRSASTPSYSPAPASTPATSSSAPSSGGGNGGSRNSGATRTGRN
jgi:hypothetical protein